MDSVVPVDSLSNLLSESSDLVENICSDRERRHIIEGDIERED